MTPARRGVLVVLCGAQFMVVLDSSIVAVALPSISRAYGVTATSASWVVGAYAVTFGGLLLAGGRAADVLGARPCLLGGLGVFSVASLAGGFAPTLELLVAARCVQGTGAAIVSPAALALIGAAFPRPGERARALGVYGAVLSTGFVAGTILGGILTELAGWRWVMFVNLPLGLGTAVAVWRTVPAVAPESTGELDAGRAALTTIAAASVVACFSAAATLGWASALVLMLGAAALAAALFAWPVVPARLAGGPLLPAAAAALLVVGAGNAMLIVLTYHLQQVLGRGPLATGLAFCGLGAASVAGALAAPRVVRRVGARAALLGGLAVQLAALLALAGLVRGRELAPLVAATTLLGLGHLIAVVVLTTLATGSAAPSDRGLAGALLLTAQQLGAGIVLALAVAVAAASAGGDPLAPAPLDGVGAEQLGRGFQAGLLTAAAGTVAAMVAARAAFRRRSTGVV